MAIVACLGWRRIAAIGAWAALAGEMVRYWYQSPDTIVRGWWMIILGAATALAALVALRGERHRVFSRRAILVTAAAASASAASGIVLVALMTQRVGPDRVLFVWSSPGLITKLADVGVRLLAGIVVAIVVGRLRPAIRRRIAVVLVPVFAVYVLIGATFSGYFLSSARFVVGVGPAAPQWAVLVVVPAACFVLGLVWLARYERMLRRIAQEGVAA